MGERELFAPILDESSNNTEAESPGGYVHVLAV
jgi:hypothetical protein